MELKGKNEKKTWSAKETDIIVDQFILRKVRNHHQILQKKAIDFQFRGLISSRTPLIACYLPPSRRTQKKLPGAA